MVIARWPRPSSAPASGAPAAIASATLLLVEPRAGAHLVGRGEIDHQHADRTVGLGLQDEAAFEFERGAEQHAEHDRLAEQLGDWLGIVVAGQDRVDRRAEPDHAAAQIEGGDLERQDRVVGRDLRWGAARDRDIGIGHRLPYLEARWPKNASPDSHRHADRFSARRGTRPECPSGHAGGFRPRRTRPIAGRRSPRR